MGLCACNHKEKLECSNGIHNGKNWHQIRISRSGERQKICRIVAMKIRGNILCSGELGGLCCRWNVYHQNLDMTDEMKHLPGAWIWKKKNISLLHHSPFGGDLRSADDIFLNQCFQVTCSVRGVAFRGVINVILRKQIGMSRSFSLFHPPPPPNHHPTTRRC